MTKRMTKIMTERRNARHQAAGDPLIAETAEQEVTKLRELLEPLDMGRLNQLVIMLMISRRWNGATGQGGIWAAASKIVNDTARVVARKRPMFELID